MSIDDRRNQPGKPFVDFIATRHIVHFDATAFAANQTGLTQRLEMLRERQLGMSFSLTRKKLEHTCGQSEAAIFI